MERDELGFALLLSVPVAAGVAAGVLKQTLGSRPLLAGATGLLIGGAVFGIVALAVRTRGPPDGEATATVLRDRIVPDSGEASPQDLLLGASVGAFVTVFLWYIPLSPLLGGAAAGYLQGGTPVDARRAGALAGALVPVMILLFALVAFLIAGARVFGRFPFGPAVAVAVSVLGVAYAVGLGAVGGWVGGLAREDERRWGNEV